ncbi:MAG TPA: DUF1634 domain-containing protein [Gemmatimonadaceae bacterium]|nr:DUF1634 domain-containing protein [Gemmatimonadaceae bacterium]
MSESKPFFAEGTEAATAARDRRVEQVIGRLLQVGVLLAAAVVLAGGVAFLAAHGGTRADFRVFRSEPSALRSVTGIVRGALALDSQAVVQLGLVLLIATPVARVALTLVAFLLQRDRLYVGMTAVVLGLLLYSLLFAPG